MRAVWIERKREAPLERGDDSHRCPCARPLWTVTAPDLGFWSATMHLGGTAERRRTSRNHARFPVREVSRRPRGVNRSAAGRRGRKLPRPKRSRRFGPCRRRRRARARQRALRHHALRRRSVPWRRPGAPQELRMGCRLAMRSCVAVAESLTPLPGNPTRRRVKPTPPNFAARGARGKPPAQKQARNRSGCRVERHCPGGVPSSITRTPSGASKTKTSPAGSVLIRTSSKATRVTFPRRSRTSVARTSPLRTSASSRSSS